MTKTLRFSLLSLLVMLCGTLFAEDTVNSIVFKDSGSDSDNSTKRTTITEIVAEGSEFVSAIPTATNVYNGRQGRGLKLGTSKANSALTLTLAEAVKPSKITFDARQYGDSEKSITVNGKAVTDLTTSFDTYTIDYDGNTEVSSIEISTPNKRAYITNVKIYLPKAGGDNTVTDYAVDFNSPIATSDHAFAVASNWEHIVGINNYDGYGPYYMTYNYKATDGFNGTGALYAARQYAGDNYGGAVCNDLLVTPSLNGAVTLKVLASGGSSTYPSFVEIYKVNDEGTEMGDLIKKFTADDGFTDIEGQDDWKQISLTLTEAQRIGIRAQNVLMDDFTAATATIIPQKKLVVTGVMNPDKQNGTQGTNPIFEQQADGKLKVTLKLGLANTGDLAIDGYSFTPAYSTYSGGTINYCEDATVTLDGTLAVGAVDTIDVNFLTALPATAYDGAYFNWYVRENVSNSTSGLYRYAKIALYQPKFVFRVAESTTTSSINTAQAYGTISEETTKQFEIVNDGIAPLTIKSITLPEGFTSSNAPTAEFVLEKKAVQAIDITLPVTTTGAYSGNLVIVYLDKDGQEQTYTLPFSGNVLAPGTWFADFNNTTSTPIFPEGSIAEGGIRTYYSYTSGAYDYYLYSYTSSSYANENNKFITPKLHATAGSKLTFDVRRDESSSSTYNLKVYVSTDRKNWGEPVFTETADNLTSAFQTKEISFETEGDYYVAFAIYGVRVDNIIGLTKVDVAHDLYIKSIKWPDASVNSGASLSKPSIDVIPLTNEAADAYTVKYVCGETVLAEGTPVELTASASNYKTFTFNWTPQVESTTVYENSKVVFDFGNGVKYESDPFTLTVKKEPKFHFVNTIPTSKWYEPTDYTTPIAFGKTNSADVQTFYVYNWGAAALNVKSIALPEGFTASVETPFTVAAFDESDMSVAAKQMDITFSATEPGEYSGDMVITYVDGLGADQTFTLAISGTKLDPTKFYASFDTEATWPAGSVYQSNVSVSNGGTYSAPNYYITSSSSTKNVFALPKMHVAAGDKLQFDAKLYSSYWSEGKVVVYTAATRSELFNTEEGTTRKQVFSVSGEDTENPLTTDYQTITVTFAEAGDYYVGLEISGRPYVDNIYGLTPVAVTHDLEIASVNIPAEGMQNNALAASVNIVNRGFAVENAYDVLVHVGDEVTTIAGTEAIAMAQKFDAEGTKVSFNIRSPKAGTFPVYVEVKAGDFTVATAPVNVTFAEETMTSELTVETSNFSSMVPLYLSYYNSESVSLYTSDVLQNNYGLKNGDKIKTITYKGYKTADNHTSTLNVWYEWTDDQTLTKPANGKFEVPASMTQHFTDQEIVWEKKGSSSESVDFITLTFAEPLVYEAGKSLRVVMYSKSDAWKGVSFENDNSATSGLTYYHNNDNESTFNTNSWTSANLPVIHIGLEATAATFSGTVKNEEDAAIAGAEVLLVSNDGDNVQYTGTTDAEGAFNFNVLQPNRTYVATVTAAGYVPATETIEFAGESQTKNFVLEPTLLAKLFVNTSLASTDGWTADASGSFRDFGNGKIGTYQVRFKPATVDETHLASEYCFGFEARWSGNFASYTQQSKVDLPAGTYTLTFDVENVNGSTSNANYENRFTVTVGNQVYTDQATEWMKGGSSWTKHTIVFSVEEPAKATLSFGYGTGSNNLSADVTPALYVSHLDLTFKSLLDGAIEALQTEIVKAEALKTEARTEGLTEFNAAIEASKALLASTDVATIYAGVEALKAAETAFLTANLPLQENTYYVYNPLTQKFLSRGNAWGTRALVDDYGVAIKVAVTDLAEVKYTLTGFDNNASYGLDTWMYSDKSGADVRSFTMKASEDGFVLTNTNNNLLMYVYMQDDADKYCVAGNGVKGDNYTDDAQTVWQFLTKEEHDAIVAAREAAQKTAAFAANDILGNAELTFAEATELTFATGHAWTQTVVRTQGGQPATNANGTEMWQATGNYTQTVTDLPAGLYKVSIQAFYRNGGADECVTRYNSGYNTVLAYLEANGNKVQVKSWAADKGEGNDPNSMDQAKAKFDEGKYLAETFASVGEDGVLNLTVNNPAFVGNGWFIAGNVKYAKAEEVILAGDANRDGEVTPADAVAAVSFALEVETPSEKAFWAADVNTSNSITVSDAVGIVNIALGVDNEQSSARGENEMVNYLTLNGTELSLTNTTTFVGFQMDVTLAEGAIFNGVDLSSRAANLQVVYNRLSGNTYRIIAFSAANEAIEGNEGALFSLNITGNNNISFSRIEFADAAAQAYELGFGEATGINGVNAGVANAEYYTVGGVKSNKAQKGMNVVRTADGKVKKVFVK